MIKQNKYSYVKVLQGNYGYGWDDVHEFCQSEGIRERKQTLKTYRENERNATHRIIDRRVLNEE